MVTTRTLPLHYTRLPKIQKAFIKKVERVQIRAPQLKMDFHGSKDGSKASQNYPLTIVCHVVFSKFGVTK